MYDPHPLLDQPDMTIIPQDKIALSIFYLKIFIKQKRDLLQTSYKKPGRGKR